MITSMNIIIWIGICLCILQSAMFSGLNLAFFSISRLRIEIEASNNNPAAIRVLALRKDSNFLLATILWGNVGVNVLLALLSDSVMTGVIAFLFSTVLITIFGEIFPQAYFSRHALKMASLLSPVLEFYQVVLYPVAKPTAKILDLWLGKEGVQYFREAGLKQMIQKHIESDDAEEINKLEGVGAMNFLAIDDVAVGQEGSPIDPKSILELPVQESCPVFPEIHASGKDAFLEKVAASGKKRIIIKTPGEEGLFVINADEFIRDAILHPESFHPMRYCHRPILVSHESITLGEVISRFRVDSSRAEDDILEDDIILVWGKTRRIITGSDILGRLLRGIAIHSPQAEQKMPRQ